MGVVVIAPTTDTEVSFLVPMDFQMRVKIMADISERFSLARIFLAVVLSGLFVNSCSTRKSDSMKLNDQERLALVGLADTGSGAAAKKLSLHFGYGKYDEQCFEQWQRMLMAAIPKPPQ